MIIVAYWLCCRYVYNANLNNSQVFATPKDNSCDGLYKNFLCDLSLPSCNPSSSSSVVSSKACRSQCKKAMKAVCLNNNNNNNIVSHLCSVLSQHCTRIFMIVTLFLFAKENLEVVVINFIFHFVFLLLMGN